MKHLLQLIGSEIKIYSYRSKSLVINNNNIKLIKTHYHLIKTTKLGKTLNIVNIPYFRYADQVSVGDELLVKGNGNLMSSEKVVNVSNIIMQGDCSCFIFLYFSSWSHTITNNYSYFLFYS